MEKTNICRPMIFYNNFVPAVKENQGWEYCAFGVFDGISIEEKIVHAKSERILMKIWDKQKQFARKLSGKYTAQIIYAFCYDDEQKEKEFWDNDNFPFTFFCRLQFRKNLKCLRDNKESLEGCMQIPGKVSSMIYMTYDNSDLVIVIKALKYADGAGLINTLHQGVNFSFDSENICELKNSFTVFAMKQTMINQTNDIGIRAELNRDKIDTVSIRLIERRCGEIGKLEEIIKRKIGAKQEGEDKKKAVPILGTDDEVICLETIGWGDFLSLYREYDGILHNSSPTYHQYIAGATTTISTEVNDYESNFAGYRCSAECENSVGADERNKEKIENYVEQMRRRVADAEKKLHAEGGYKELYMILNALPKFSGEVFSDYVFFAVLSPIRTLLDLIEKDMNDSYYEFIKCFNMYIQNSVKADRHAMQIVDFNTKIYDIPSKLNAFYTAFIYKVSDILNVTEEGDEKHTYDFIVVPGVANKVNVVELYKKVSEYKRLLRVEIPENRFYDSQNIMIIFCHEAAHYVGTVLRSRKSRYKSILKSTASIYVEYIRSYWLDGEWGTDVFLPDETWETVKDRMSSLLELMLERELNKDYLRYRQIGPYEKSEEQIENIVQSNKTYKEYFSFLNHNIYRAMDDIVQGALVNVFGNIIFEFPEEEQKNVLRAIQDESGCFLVKFAESTTKTTMETVLERISSLYEESFADLIAVSLLELDVRDYLNGMIKEAVQQESNIDTISRTESVYRILVVFHAMYSGETREKWMKNCYAEDEYLEERHVILNSADKVMKMIRADWKNDMSPKEYRNCCFYSLISKDIYRNVLNYLLECKTEFQKNMNSDRGDERKRLSAFFAQYKVEKNSNIERMTAEMEEFIVEYKQKVFGEIAEI